VLRLNLTSSLPYFFIVSGVLAVTYPVLRERAEFTQDIRDKSSKFVFGEGGRNPMNYRVGYKCAESEAGLRENLYLEKWGVHALIFATILDLTARNLKLSHSVYAFPESFS